jgi:hypothetical protein
VPFIEVIRKLAAKEGVPVEIRVANGTGPRACRRKSEGLPFD